MAHKIDQSLFDVLQDNYTIPSYLKNDLRDISDAFRRGDDVNLFDTKKMRDRVKSQMGLAAAEMMDRYVRDLN